MKEQGGARSVTSGVPQGSVLAPIMFLVHVITMPEGIHGNISLPADDAKPLRKLRDKEDCKEMQKDLSIPTAHDRTKT